MPYSVRKVEDKYCLFKKDSDGDWSNMGKGYCHDSESEADAQRRAILANEDKGQMSLYALPPMEFSSDVAGKALEGDVVEIMPREQFFDHNGVLRTVDQSAIDMFVYNWENRASVGIRRTRLAVDDDHSGRALGWYKSVVSLSAPQGLGASFSWNKRGRESLENNEYAYFSPSVYWGFRDRKTNEMVRFQLGGGALTNYPYFGEVTSLMNARGSVLVREDSDIVSLYAITKRGGDGRDYPSSAYLVVGDSNKPTTWHFRVKSYKNGRLVYDHAQFGIVKMSLTQYQGSDREVIIDELKGLYVQEGLDFNSTVNISGGLEMGEEVNAEQLVERTVEGVFSRFAKFFGGGSDNGDGGSSDLSSEDVAQLRADFATLNSALEKARNETETIRSNYDTRITELNSRLGASEAARMLAQFTTEAAQEFSSIPASIDDIASHMMWLSSVDTSDDKSHYTFFKEVLIKANEKFSAQFSAMGVDQMPISDATENIKSKVEKYMSEHPDVGYEDALSAVVAANPQLYSQHVDGVRG